MELSASTDCMTVWFMCEVICVCMLLISLEAKIHAGCLACRAECDIDTPNAIYTVSYAFIIGNTMREQERERKI